MPIYLISIVMFTHAGLFIGSKTKTVKSTIIMCLFIYFLVDFIYGMHRGGSKIPPKNGNNYAGLVVLTIVR